ncbi:PAAR-like domain-containing protein [Winslowiella iniecta]|uniref:PAAR-like domain-containing protein n=1 Tax=Winslowiella iniecta TaxID=1560201 RepID=UPI0012E15ADD|nr:PAAR-like domain-containing protein [Winslowiella iniecta]
MPSVNTNAGGLSTSGSDVLSLGLIIVVAENTLPNSSGAVNVPNVLICGGYVQTLSTQFCHSATKGAGVGICSATHSGKGSHMMSSSVLIIKGNGATYLGCAGITNSGNTACIQSTPGQYTVHVNR